MKQYYSLSKSILEKIKQANKILINVHRNPDLDSVGSATALYQALIKISGKKPALICPHQVPENLKFLKAGEIIKPKIDNLQKFIINVAISQDKIE